MPRPCIYTITNIVNGSCYVGSTVDFKRRRSAHLGLLRRGKHHSQHLQNAYTLYGEQSFVFSVLEDVVKDKQILFEREDHWIDELKPAYNVGWLIHSSLGAKRTEETRERMRGHTFTDEQRQRISESNKATRANWTEEQRKKAVRSRKPYSEETRQKMRDAKAGKKLSPEHIENRTKAQRGIKPSEETREKMRLSNKIAAQRRKDEGIQPRLHTEESRARMSELHKARWAKKKAQQAEMLEIIQPELFD